MICPFLVSTLTPCLAARRGSKIETSKGHLTFGLFYSAYDPKIWWWEITVTFRKIFVAYMGVFGGAWGEFQVHFTACVMFIVVLLTAIVRPFGKHKLLQFLELITLAGTWLTLWAGTIFNSLPQCEDDKGVAVGWCNALSVFIGLLNIASVVAVVVGFIYYKQQKRCNACGKKVYGEVVVARRRRTMERRQNELRTRMSQVDLVDNPCDTEREIEIPSIENNPCDTEREIEIPSIENNEGGEAAGGDDDDETEMTSIDAIESLEDGWTRFQDLASGREYLHNAETDETKWADEVTPIADESGLVYEHSNPSLDHED